MCFQVYDGEDNSAELLATLCGNEIPKEIVGSGASNYLYAEFNTNADGLQGKGYKGYINYLESSKSPKI